MEVAELVRLRTKIEVIKYALAHIETRIQCGDIDIAKKAADVCSGIVDIWAASYKGLEEQDDEQAKN